MKNRFKKIINLGTPGFLLIVSFLLGTIIFQSGLLLIFGLRYFTFLDFIQFELLFFVVGTILYYVIDELLLKLIKKKKEKGIRINILYFSAVVSKDIIILFIINIFNSNIYISPIAITIIPIVQYFIFNFINYKIDKYFQ